MRGLHSQRFCHLQVSGASSMFQYCKSMMDPTNCQKILFQLTYSVRCLSDGTGVV